MIIGESLNLSDLEENDIYYAQNLISIQNIHQTGVTEDNFEEVNYKKVTLCYFIYYSLRIYFVKGYTVFIYDWYRLDG
jgi:hypothetical protein